MSHINNGACPKCKEIMDRYPGLNQILRDWFVKTQARHPNFHTSCAGRGEIDQEACFHRGASRAHYGQSSHNYNAAFDGFFLVEGKYSLDKKLFMDVAQDLPVNINWYGLPGATFPELPHFDIKNWRRLVQDGLLRLVE